MGTQARLQLKEVLINHKPSICFILEPQGPFDKIAYWLQIAGYEAMHVSEATGRAGGIWLLKRMNCNVSCLIVHHTDRLITATLSRGTYTWSITGVYASPNFAACHQDWDHIRYTASLVSGPWSIIEDWNETLNPTDSLGGSYYPSRAELFRNLLADCGVDPIHTIGPQFTWRKSTTDPLCLQK